MIDRYSRQILFPAIGEKGQEKLGNSSAVIIGCGALGTIIATSLVRAGVGRVILRNSTDESLARGLYAKYVGA